MFSQISRIPDLIRNFSAKRCGLYAGVYGIDCMKCWESIPCKQACDTFTLLPFTVMSLGLNVDDALRAYILLPVQDDNNKGI